MKAHIINLPNRTDRRAEMIDQCSKLGIEPLFFEATNGKEKFEHIDSRLLRGHYGCLDSHKRLLQSIHGTDKKHLILEDDAVLHYDYEQAFDGIGWLDYDIVYLGGNVTQLEGATIPYSITFNRAVNVLCTHAYVIRDSSIPKLLEVLNSRMDKVDILFTEFQKQSKAFITKKCYAWQAVSHSDITNSLLDGEKLKY
jgi:GR25 family glycosyltransferase involved in LPS biosynthesis